MAIGHPFAGRVPAGTNRLKKRSGVLWTAGTPVRVGTLGIKAPAVSKFLALNFPKAIDATDPGKTCSAGVGTGTVFNGPTVLTCCPKRIPITELTENTVRSPCEPRLKFTEG